MNCWKEAELGLPIRDAVKHETHDGSFNFFEIGHALQDCPLKSDALEDGESSNFGPGLRKIQSMRRSSLVGLQQRLHSFHVIVIPHDAT